MRAITAILPLLLIAATAHADARVPLDLRPSEWIGAALIYDDGSA